MIILAFVAVALAIAMAGSLVVVAACIRAEDRYHGLSYKPPTLTASIVRRLTGLRVCPPDLACSRRRPATVSGTHTRSNRQERP
jgi:hypothetical protein